MQFVYLDEFGHVGPFVSRSHPHHNASPVFGLAGFVMPAENVRLFGSRFLRLKKLYLASDPSRQDLDFFEWEKKGTNLFTARSILRYPTLRELVFRLLGEMQSLDGKIVYVGRQKIKSDNAAGLLNPSGLYTTVFADMIRALDGLCTEAGEGFAIVLDQNNVRPKLLATAAKTMYGRQGALRMVCPPFEVESHLNQQVQAADWLATIIGRMVSYALEPDEFAEFEHYSAYFKTRVAEVSVIQDIRRR